jgi:hypothetical protein
MKTQLLSRTGYSNLLGQPKRLCLELRLKPAAWRLLLIFL